MNKHDTCACGGRKRVESPRCRKCTDKSRIGQSNFQGGIPIATFASLLRRVCGDRGHVELAHEVAAGGQMTFYTAERRLRMIFNPSYLDKKGRRAEQKLLSFGVADKILTALDLTYLWHTELAEAIVEPSVAKAWPGWQRRGSSFASAVGRRPGHHHSPRKEGRMTAFPTSFADFDPAAPTIRGLAQRALAMNDATREFREYFFSLVASGELMGASWHETEDLYRAVSDEDMLP